MHADLSRRITQLICTADNISPLTLKSEMLLLAQHCQVVPENRFLVRTICQSLESAAFAVFGPLTLLLVMTEPRRRQVYFAVLARLEMDGAFEGPGFTEAARADLLSRLVLSRNEDLIAQTYGSCPSGFLRLIGRFGDRARWPKIYTALFGLLDAHPDLARPLLAHSKTGELTNELIELSQVLPPTALGVRIAGRFDTPDEYQRFMRPYQAITGLTELSEPHMWRIAEGEAPSNLLERMYLDLPFPAPVLADPALTHIANGQALVRTARKFSNCLASQVAEALKGARQFFVWRTPNKEPAVVFAINNEVPFGWFLAEAKLAGNERVPRPRREELMALLAAQGIRTEGSVKKMMGSHWSDLHPFIMGDHFELFEED